MKTAVLMQSALALIVGGVLAVGPVMADKPEWADKGKDERKDEKKAHHEYGKDEKKARHEYEKQEKKAREEDARRHHFEERHRMIVREYYDKEYRGGHCPPGLKKKHDGCMPPGQARKWKYGRPLPRDVAYYEVPQSLVVQIGVPPSGYRYVRVASDILMIAIGTNMVVDAIQDLGRQ